MSINIPTFESVEEKIEWIKEQMITLNQDAEHPALEADRLQLVSALDAALEEAGVEIAPEIEKPYIQETNLQEPPVQAQD
jgi:ABC-type phosphate transport system auxiliary subunit